MRTAISLAILASCADADTTVGEESLDLDDTPTATAVCTTGDIRCDAFVRTTPSGTYRAFAAPNGYGPADLQDAYSVPPPIGRPTIAIVDAYGYAALESDLGVYRAQYGLPACTRANGCLTIVNASGQTSPLPADPPATDDWTLETALDVQMASAICPACRILVVQATDNMGTTLYTAQNSAAALGATVISNSWGGPETTQKIAFEPNFDHPGIAIFVSAGDHGYNEGGAGPHYPSVSAHVISVGGTRLVRDAGARGWNEVAWSLASGNGTGSSCSAMVAKPAYQSAVPCAFKAATDISAVADPATGVAVYNSKYGWIVLGGTSAAAPIVASIFAVAGHGADASGPFVAQHSSRLYDIKSGSNGACGSAICNAGAGWDGPTGYGSPNATLLASTGAVPGLAVTSPANGAHVAAGFSLTADAANAATVALAIDGQPIAMLDHGPFSFATPATLAPGSHTLDVTATALTGATGHTSLAVIVDPPMTGGDSGGGEPLEGNCAASHGASWLMIGIALAFARRRRQ
jgi:subtilase family serine protease